MLNGKHHEMPAGRVEQRIDAGAIVRLDDAVLQHGVLFLHPVLPPIKLHVILDPEGKKLPQYHFEPIEAKHGDKTIFAIDLHEVVAKESIIQPEKKLILPGG